MKVLMVCTGNLCRSPMAEALLRHRLAERGCDIGVASVGTWANFGQPATPEAIEVLHRQGVDLTSHNSRAVDPRELAAADLVVAMTSVHRRELLQIAPEVESKLVLMKELVELGLDPTVPLSAEERLARLLGASRPKWRRALDLDDPMGKPVGAYERTLAQLEVGIEVLVDALCGPKGG